MIDRNTAGKIEEMAQKQFGSAKETTGDVGDRFIDAADNFSHNMGYNVFGFGPGNYIQAFGEGFDEYGQQRENGISKEIAAKRAAVNTGVSLAGEKLFDKGFDWASNKFIANSALFNGGKALSAKGWSDSRNKLDKIENRDIIETQSGFACFPDPRQNEYAKRIAPEIYIDHNGNKKTYFDVSMHGTSQSVGFWSEETNMSPRFLAEMITHNKNYQPGQRVRLLSCNTGAKDGGDYCFAEELSNIMSVKVEAPNDKIYMFPNGNTKIGRHNEGKFVLYVPNDRGRLK